MDKKIKSIPKNKSFASKVKKHLKEDIHESKESIREDKKLIAKYKMKGKC